MYISWIFGNNEKIDSLSDSDDFGEEVIYSQESTKMEEFIRDFDWDLNRIVWVQIAFHKKKKHYLLKNQNLDLGLELKLYLI